MQVGQEVILISCSGHVFSRCLPAGVIHQVLYIPSARQVTEEQTAR